jgi:hypothetical protein
MTLTRACTAELWEIAIKGQAGNASVTTDAKNECQGAPLAVQRFKVTTYRFHRYSFTIDRRPAHCYRYCKIKPYPKSRYNMVCLTSRYYHRS